MIMIYFTMLSGVALIGSVAASRQLGEVLRGIHGRLVSEGWLIDGAVFTPPPGYPLPKPAGRPDSNWPRTSR